MKERKVKMWEKTGISERKKEKKRERNGKKSVEGSREERRRKVGKNQERGRKEKKRERRQRGLKGTIDKRGKKTKTEQESEPG
ncbi:hypothetical protein XELAEV_18008539mg [Xenopus laevis]|uniref:Uncharacterized protein n=1 Tax=Xenopus laevis TaxID=8355 RepID=A0A974I664_XENLA|nr:hypothetical protein XELAEV_18008539mg [Xenopus laevis]